MKRGGPWKPQCTWWRATLFPVSKFSNMRPFGRRVGEKQKPICMSEPGPGNLGRFCKSRIRCSGCKHWRQSALWLFKSSENPSAFAEKASVLFTCLLDVFLPGTEQRCEISLLIPQGRIVTESSSFCRNNQAPYKVLRINMKGAFYNLEGKC